MTIHQNSVKFRKFHSVPHSPKPRSTSTSKKETLYDKELDYVQHLERLDGSTKTFVPSLNHNKIFLELESEVRGDGVETGFSNLSIPVRIYDVKKNEKHTGIRFALQETIRYRLPSNNAYMTMFASDKYGNGFTANRCFHLRLTKHTNAGVHTPSSVNIRKGDLIVLGVYQTREKMRGVLVYTVDGMQTWPENHVSVSPLAGKHIGLLNVSLVYIHVFKMNFDKHSPNNGTLEWINPTYLLKESHLDSESGVLLDDGTLDLTSLRKNLNNPSFIEAKKILQGFDKLTREVESRLRKRTEIKNTDLLPYRDLAVPSKETLYINEEGGSTKDVSSKDFFNEFLERVNKAHANNKNENNKNKNKVLFSIRYELKEGKTPLKIEVRIDGDPIVLVSHWYADELDRLDVPQFRSFLENKTPEEFLKELEISKQKTITLSIYF